MKPKKHIITAWAESSAGPGWANAPIWYLWRYPGGQYQEGCIQPENQTAEMRALYAVSQAAHFAMLEAVRKVVKWDANYHTRHRAKSGPRWMERRR